MRNKEEIRLQRVVMALCAILFAVFSFLFVAVYQAPLLEVLYEKVATGKLQYNPYVAGGFISAILTILALWLNKFTAFKREWTALSFIPSVLILTFVTDINRGIYTGEYNYVKWITVFAVGVFAYAAFSFVLRRMLFAKIKNIAMSANRIIWRNLQIFVIMFCLTGFLVNGEENFKREALIHSCYNKGDTEKALKVGYLSNTASQSLTAQRAYILAKEGLLGEKLFEYPQLYGSEGLLPQQKQISPLAPDSVFAMLGTSPASDESSSATLLRAVSLESPSTIAKEYYLSALLLDRRIVDFVDAMGRIYPDTDFKNLPKHYQEAIMLYASISGDTTSVCNNNAMQEQFNAFRTLEIQHEDPFVRGNHIRRKFGRTYWWYYLYGNI